MEARCWPRCTMPFRIGRSGSPTCARRMTRTSRTPRTRDCSRLGKYWPIQVETAQSFLAEHARFLDYTEGPDVGKDRVTSTALRAGWSVRVVAFDGFRV